MRFIPNNNIIRGKNSKLALKDYIKFEGEDCEPVATDHLPSQKIGLKNI